MSRCPGCNLDFSGSQTHCCKHCRDGHSEHGKNCTVRLTCASCSNSLQRFQGKYINQRFYCCGHCEGAQHNPCSTRRQHSRHCIVSTAVASPTSRISFSQQPSMQSFGQSARSRSRSRHADRCIICHERPIEIACVPCGHRVLCQSCSERYTQEGNDNHCLMCRCRVDWFMKTYDP